MPKIRFKDDAEQLGSSGTKVELTGEGWVIMHMEDRYDGDSTTTRAYPKEDILEIQSSDREDIVLATGQQ